jgi:hypothetical protein
MGVFPASVEYFTGPHPKMACLFFSLFSILNIWLVWRICRTTGAGEFESLMAAVFCALSNSWLYYARHFVPYDAAMTFGLVSVLLAVAEPSTLKNSFLGGLSAFGAFFMYCGYWTLAAFGLIILAIPRPFSFRRCVQQGAASAAGFIIPMVILIGSSALFHGNLLGSFISFSQSAVQGDFHEGWRLPAAYFWHSEHCILPIWITACILCVWKWSKGSVEKRVVYWIAGIVFIYGCLALFSNGFKMFVVYGRLARQLVPFFCLISAYFFSVLAKFSMKRSWKPIALASFIIIQAACNFYRPLVQVFPADFLKKSSKMADDSGKYRLLFVEHIYPAPQRVSLPPYEIILMSPHPLQFLPYQYEGYTPAQRAALRSTDISMKLVRIK